MTISKVYIEFIELPRFFLLPKLMYDIIELNSKKVSDLREIATKLGLQRTDKLKKQDLVYSILDEQALRPSANKPKEKAPAPAKAASKSGPKASTKTESKKDGTASSKK